MCIVLHHLIFHFVFFPYIQNTLIKDKIIKITCSLDETRF
jgi:hypothetical protein